MLMDEAWATEYSVECPVPRDFAWQFWTDVNNWRLDSDIESIELRGPFAAGSRGVSNTRSTGRIEWRLVSVQPKTGAVLEIPVQGCCVQFRWRFDDLGERTRMTQRISLAGEGAVSLVSAIAPMLESNIPGGMKKLCEAMTKAAAQAC